MNLYIILVLLISTTTLQSQKTQEYVTPAFDLLDVEEMILEYDPQYLFLDIDENMIVHDTTICYGWCFSDHLVDYMTEIDMHQSTISDIQDQMSVQYYAQQMRWVDTYWVQLIKKMQSRGIKVYPLTSNKLTAAYSQEVLQFFQEQFQKYDLTFSPLIDNKFDPQSLELSSLNISDDLGVFIFESGVKADKGQRLAEFLEKQGIKPSKDIRTILVDDTLKKLTRARDSLAKTEYQFFPINYLLAERQFNKVQFLDEWSEIVRDLHLELDPEVQKVNKWAYETEYCYVMPDGYEEQQQIMFE